MFNVTTCNCRHWTCIVDSACHALHVRWQWVCDRHDAHILGVRIERLER